MPIAKMSMEHRLIPDKILEELEKAGI